MAISEARRPHESRRQGLSPPALGLRIVITARLVGGMGNQLFQYAAGFALASRLGVALQLDRSWFHGRNERQYRLDAFSISARDATDEALRGAGIRYPGRLVRGLSRLGFRKWARMRGHVFEPGFTYWPGFRELGDGACLSGYWQSERYFEDVADAIRREFTLRHEPDAENQAALRAIRGCEAVAIHVRRGDYAADARSRQYHGTTSLEYYEAAVRRILSITPDPVFFMFSDDPAWAKKSLRVSAPTVHVTHNGAARDYEDLRLMSACRHHIIANSTFSWWGAWLADPSRQRVIAPERWFQDGPDTRDLIPARWERI